jgi:hypothetical protein
MAFEQAYDVVIGSGTLPSLAQHKRLQGTVGPDTHPVVDNDRKINARRGLGAVVLNPEDHSVHLGLGQQNIAVSSTALPLPASPLDSRRALVIHNNGPDILYIGDPNVTTANGFPMAVNEKIAIDIQGNQNVWVYGVSAGTSDVRIMELA